MLISPLISSISIIAETRGSHKPKISVCGAAVIELCKAAFGGLAVFCADVQAGLLHRAHDHVEADVARAAQQAGQVEGVHGALGSHGVALDTRDLDKAADRVARQAEVVLHGDLGGVFRLLDAQTHQSAQCGCGHGAGRADLCLTAAFRAGDGAVALDESAEQAGDGQRAQDLRIGNIMCFLHIQQHGGQHACGATGRRGDDGAVVGVPIIPVPGIPTPIAFFRILALSNTVIFSGRLFSTSAAFATHNATAIGSVQPMAGITSDLTKAIICRLSVSVISFLQFDYLSCKCRKKQTKIPPL